jgi:hypothetical protein
MFDYLIIALVGILGLSGAGWWVILFGAAGLAIQSWFELYEIIRKRRPAIPLDWNLVGFYSGAIAKHIAISAAAYLAGFFLSPITR